MANQGKPKAGPRVDPVVTVLVRNGVIALTVEMKTNLMRTAYNVIIYEALDFTTGLFTADGRTVSLRLDGELKDDLPNAKVITRPLKAGDQLIARGGGFSAPLGSIRPISCGRMSARNMSRRTQHAGSMA